MTRHVIGFGFFCEAGVKNEAADASVGTWVYQYQISLAGVIQMRSLLILDPTLRRSGGGEMLRVGEAVRLTPPSAILRARVRDVM